MYILGQLLTPESLSTEYKEFRLELSYQETDCQNIIKNPRLLEHTFQNIISRFIDKYICKYACSFFNSKIDGVLKFGVSDIGEVIGVPIKKESFDFVKNDLENNIRFCLANRISGVKLTNILDNINVSFHRIDLEDYIYFDYQKTDDFIKEIEENNTKYLKYKSQYIDQKTRFINLIGKYRRSINCIINDSDIRKEFIYYLKITGVYSKFKHIFLHNPTIVFTSENIKTQKYDKNTIIYWITTFRDDITDYIIKHERPVKDLKMKWMDPYYRLLQDFKPLVPRLCQSENYEMYIIKIEFNYYGRSKEFMEASYYNGEDHRSPYRIHNESGFPCCI